MDCDAFLPLKFAETGWLVFPLYHLKGPVDRSQHHTECQPSQLAVGQKQQGSDLYNPSLPAAPDAIVDQPRQGKQQQNFARQYGWNPIFCIRILSNISLYYQRLWPPKGITSTGNNVFYTPFGFLFLLFAAAVGIPATIQKSW